MGTTPIFTVREYLAQKLIARCFNCKGKTHVKHVDVGTVLCPDCNHALFWERLNPGDQIQKKLHRYEWGGKR